MLELILEGAGALAETAVDAAGEVAGEVIDAIGAAGEAIGEAVAGASEAAVADDGARAVWVSGDVLSNGILARNDGEDEGGRSPRPSATAAALTPEAPGEGNRQELEVDGRSAAEIIAAQEQGLDEMFGPAAGVFDEDEL